MNQTPCAMPTPGLVSVIMNCLNCEKYLREAIDSVYAQTYPHWEIILWDNASTDDSAAIARNYDAHVKYRRGDKTIPRGAARNLAICEAGGEFIAFLDCDDIWMPTKLEKQVPLFADPEVALVYSDTIFFNNTGMRKQIYKHRPYYTGYCFEKLLTDYFLSMETVVIRRQALNALGHWFDERFNMIEEADLFRRLAYDHKLAMVNEALAMWRVHENSWTSKQPTAFGNETEMMLESYRTLYSDFEIRYAAEIMVLRRGIAFTQAKLLWQKGEGQKARHLLHGHLLSPKCAALYLLTMLPQKLAERLVSAVGR